MKNKRNKKLLKKSLGIILSATLVLSLFPICDSLHIFKEDKVAAVAQEQADAPSTALSQTVGANVNDGESTNTGNLANNNNDTDTTNTGGETGQDSDQDLDNTDNADNSSNGSANEKDAINENAENETSTADGQAQTDAATEDETAAAQNTTETKETAGPVAPTKQDKQNSNVKSSRKSQKRAASSITTDNMYEGVCRVATDPSFLYCRTIDDAIDYLNENGGGVIEIFKDVTLSSAHTISTEITIKNITSNVTSTVLNPTKNGNNNAQPVVTYAVSGQLIVGSGGTLNLKGCILDGADTTRAAVSTITNGSSEYKVSGAIALNGGTLNIDNGDAGAADTGISATETLISNFKSSLSQTGAVIWMGAGTTNFNSGKISGNENTSAYAGAFYILRSTLNINGGEISNNTASAGAAIYLNNSGTVYFNSGTIKGNNASIGAGIYTFDVSAHAYIKGGEICENVSSGEGAAAYAEYGYIHVSGGKITKNTSGSGGAVSGDAAQTTGIYLSDTPYIVNNTSAGKVGNLKAFDASKIKIDGHLSSSARVGISYLVGSGTQFATISASGVTANTLKYLAIFSNDTNATYIPDPTITTTAAKWREPKDADSKDYVCYITSAGITTYYISLQTAIAAAAEGETIEIFKSHAFSLGSGIEQALTKSITIMNVNNPLNDGVNWLKNGNTKDATDNPNGEPLVSLAKADRIVVGDGATATTVTIKGLRIKGEAAEATNADGRQKSVLRTNASANLKFLKGEEGTDNYGNTLSSANYATSIYNQSQANADGGGLLCMQADSEATLEQITMTDSLSYSDRWNGGGTIVSIVGRATLNINGGEYTGLKCRGGGNWGEASIKVSQGADGTVVNMDGVYAHDNTGSHGGFITSSDSLVAEFNINDCTFIKNIAYIEGGAVYAGGGSADGSYTTLNITGDTRFEQNEASRCGSAFSCRGHLNISDNVVITNNTNHGTDSAGTYVGGAIDAYASGSRNWTFSGSPRIYGNSPADVAIYSSNQVVQVGNLGKGAHVGVQHYTADMNAAGKQFATTINASAAAESNLAGAFFNDVDNSLVSIPGDANAAIWGSAVVKETAGSTGTGAFVKYYESLNAALAGVTSGNTLEILKTHTLTADATLAADTVCYIRNIVNPINDTENPFIDDDGNINYSQDSEPVVYFSRNDGTNINDYRLTINGTATIEGIKFSGYSWTGSTSDAVSVRSRATSGMYVSATGNLTIKDGSAGEFPDGSERSACATEITNFVNTTTGTSNYLGGGFLMVNGLVTMEGGTISGCNASSNGWKGGGSVAKISGTSDTDIAKFYLKGGTITNNAKTAYGYSGCCFSQGQYALFEMTGGLVTGNGRTDGAIHGAVTGGYEQDVSKTITVSGGTVSNNSGTNAAFYMGKGTVTINGDNTLITGNIGSNAGSVIHTRSGCTVNIGGKARITGNEVLTTSGQAGEDKVGTSAISLVNQTETVNISGSPTVSENYCGTIEANVASYAPACMNINAIEKGAHVGVYALNTSSKIAGGTFATGGTDATNAGYLTSLYNDRTNDDNSNPLRGADNGDQYVKWASVTPTVKVTETVTSTNATTGLLEYTDVIHTFSGTTAIADAFACVATIPEGNKVKAEEGSTRPYQGYFPIELLYQTHDDYSITAQVSVATGANRPIMFTTAMTQDQQKAHDMGDSGDGYYGPYDGSAISTSAETGKVATIKRGATFASMFAYTTAGTNVTVKNLFFDGQKATYQTTSRGGTFNITQANASITFESGVVIKNALGVAGNGNTAVYNSAGSAVFANANNTAIYIKGDTAIKNCGDETGSIGQACVYSDSNAGIIEMSGTSSITGCYSSQFGGALSSYRGTIILKENATVTGCKGDYASVARIVSAKMYIRDNAKLTGNKTTTEDTDTSYYGAIYPYNADTAVYVSGNIQVTGNTNASGNPANLIDSSAENVGNKIYVEEAGLGKNAKVGVYSVSNCDAGDTFARTVANQAASSNNAVNLSRFINDKETSLTGEAGSADAVVWGKSVPVKIIINHTQAPIVDTYYTLQIQAATTGARTRVPITVPAGKTSGGIIVMLPAGMKSYISCIENGSAYGYTLSSPAYVNTVNTSKGGTALGDDKDELEESTSFLCSLTVNSTNTSQGNIDTDSGVRELSFTSTWAAPDNPTKLTGQMEVTNTLEE